MKIARLVALSGVIALALVSGCSAGAGAKGEGTAQAEKVSVRTETVTYTVDGKTYRGVLAYSPDFKGKRPGVLVCHEWWGNNAYSQGRAVQLATIGYVAFALDMYGDGVTTTKPDEAGKLAGGVYGDLASMRRRAAGGLDVLVRSGKVDASRVAAIGYCFGGSVALELARSGAELDAVVCFHTSNLTAKDGADNGKIKAEVLVCNGAADPMAPKAKVDEAVNALSAAGVKATVMHYDGAVHAFTNPEADGFNIPGVKYDAVADKHSWDAMRALFARTIDGK
ncbi:MAG: dienelactone hydrolase family protein [Phycisphaerales bacterium]